MSVSFRSTIAARLSFLVCCFPHGKGLLHGGFGVEDSEAVLVVGGLDHDPANFRVCQLRIGALHQGDHAGDDGRAIGESPAVPEHRLDLVRPNVDVSPGFRLTLCPGTDTTPG